MGLDPRTNLPRLQPVPAAKRAGSSAVIGGTATGAEHRGPYYRSSGPQASANQQNVASTPQLLFCLSPAGSECFRLVVAAAYSSAALLTEKRERAGNYNRFVL